MYVCVCIYIYIYIYIYIHICVCARARVCVRACACVCVSCRRVARGAAPVGVSRGYIVVGGGGVRRALVSFCRASSARLPAALSGLTVTRYSFTSSRLCLCVSCVGPAALCVGRCAASCDPLSVPLSYDIHSLSSVCRSPPLLRCSRTVCTRINRPFMLPVRLHCPHCCNLNSILLGQYTTRPRPPFCMRCILQD